MAFKHRDVGGELDRTEWEGQDTHEIEGKPAGDVIVPSLPPVGKKRVQNIYYDPDTGEMFVEVED